MGKVTEFHLVGITGLAQSGKDTAKDYLRIRHALGEYSFAAPLKAAAAILLGLPFEVVNNGPRNEVIPGLGLTIREFLQKLGTEAIRNTIHQDFWLLRAEAAMKSMKAKGYRGMVISDVRFNNEAAWIAKNGGKIIRINRDGLQQMDHASEKGIDSVLVDFEVPNNGTVADLHERLRILPL